MSAEFLNALAVGTTYLTKIYLAQAGSSSSGSGTLTSFASQRYVTSSGEVTWFFALRDKATKEIFQTWLASDHPCFGNGGDPDQMPHPFGDIKESQEVICVTFTPEEIDVIKAGIPKGKSLLQYFNEEYIIDDASAPIWPTKEVTVGLPEGYDWQMAKSGDEVKTIKLAIPKPGNILCKKLKLK
jgi:hypothetical protein